MIQIHSTGRPVLIDEVVRGDKIIHEGTVYDVTVNSLIGSYCRLATFTIFGFQTLSLPAGTMVNLAERDSLENPATSMEIYLALKDKGAL